MKEQELKEVLSLYLPYGVEMNFGEVETINDVKFLIEGSMHLKLYPLAIVNKEWLAEKVTIIIFPDSNIYDIERDILSEVEEILFRQSHGVSEDWETMLSYRTIQFLASHHIDFANLIGQGYAIEKEVEE